NRPAKAIEISSEALFQRNLSGKRNNRRFVSVGSHYCFDERARSRLLVRQSALFGAAGINKNCHGEWQIDIRLKGEYLLKLTILEYLNIFFLHIADEAFVA